MSEIRAFIKETSERSLAPSAMCGYGEKMAIYESENKPSPDDECVSLPNLDLILDSLASRTVRN